ncbi:MAG: formylglycine-generating enzyme family protein [Prosthecobacter sp.]
MRSLFSFSVAAFFATSLCQCYSVVNRPFPVATKEDPFVNSLGMQFVPVPGTRVLMCTTETTIHQYRASGRIYNAPPFAQGRMHPAVNVSWNDAKAWCAWLSAKEGRRYRLPTDAEWSAAGDGSTYPWGNAWPPPDNVGNYAGQEMRECTSKEVAWLQSGHGSYFDLADGWTIIGGFRDGHKFTSPVGSYAANQHGFYDLGGNVREWCESGKTDSNIIRDAGWYNDGKREMASSHGYYSASSRTHPGHGFRVMVTP